MKEYVIIIQTDYCNGRESEIDRKIIKSSIIPKKGETQSLLVDPPIFKTIIDVHELIRVDTAHP